MNLSTTSTTDVDITVVIDKCIKYSPKAIKQYTELEKAISLKETGEFKTIYKYIMGMNQESKYAIAATIIYYMLDQRNRMIPNEWSKIKDNNNIWFVYSGIKIPLEIDANFGKSSIHEPTESLELTNCDNKCSNSSGVIAVGGFLLIVLFLAIFGVFIYFGNKSNNKSK